MSEIIPPTCEEIRDDQLKSVDREVDNSWRHGCYINEVYYREADDTYWNVSYRLSTDGETYELREGSADISQVFPVTETVTITKYVSKK